MKANIIINGDKSNQFHKLDPGDFFIYGGLLYLKIREYKNDTIIINAVRICDGERSFFMNDLIEDVKSVKIMVEK